MGTFELTQNRWLQTSLLFSFPFLICLSFNLMAYAASPVNWACNNLSPFYIKEGPFAGKGISDQLINFFTQKLPQYQHHEVFMNHARLYKEAENGTLVCNPLLLKTPERSDLLLFSKPFKPAYAHVLVSTHPIDYPEDGLSLKEFISGDDPHEIVVQAGRSYGPEIDHIIQGGVKDNRIKSEHYSTGQMFAMLERGRLPHFIDIENSVSYYVRQNAGSQKIYNIPIKEDRLDRYGYVACAKTPEGEALISQINQVLDQEGDSPAFRSILESWITPESLPRFRRFYDQEILKK